MPSSIPTCSGCEPAYLRFALTRFVPFEKTELRLASLGENSNLIGAARVWHYRFGREDKRAG